MKRIVVISLGIGLILAAAAATRAGAPTQVREPAQAVEKLHRDALVWDCHNDLAYRVLYEGLDIGNRLPGGQVDIPRMREGGVDVQVVALFIQNFLYPDKCARQAFQLLEAMTRNIEKNS
ncbi:MAG: membrane dipeptidase, partial [Longimicrobiales bacterium]|nr:membrane dipeptidase [Longimicrobiales bacterium]